MALKLATIERGISVEYHKIIYQNTDYRKGTTQCVMGLYVDRAHRDDNVNNWLLLEPFEFEGNDLTREQLYTAITVSKTEEIPIVEEPAVEEPVADEKEVVGLPPDGEAVKDPPVDGEGVKESLGGSEIAAETKPTSPTVKIVETNKWALAEKV